MTDLVSVHGGHSGQFCLHAEDTLSQMVQRYAELGFAWVGITEHMPPAHDRLRYEEERRAGMDARALAQRFDRYIAACRRLQADLAGRLDIRVGFETEMTSGSLALAAELVDRYRPDYIVGSVHHVNDLPIDTSPEDYRQAAGALGGMEALYQAYFDQQYEMIETLKPAVVGHFDLIRIFDPDYRRRLAAPAVAPRVERNLSLIRDLDLILDFNVAALRKGADEPYLTADILARANELGIAVVPGDDSHGVATVGQNLEKGMAILSDAGFDTRWRRP